MIKQMSGFTLLEILLASSMGSFVAIILLVLFSHYMALNFEVNKRCELLESGRFTCFFLRDQFAKAIKVYSPAKNNIELTLKNLAKVNFYTHQNKQSTKGRADYSLYMKEQGKPRIEIAPGIAEMQLLYGVKCPDSNNICRYQMANELVDWNQVKGIEAHLFSAPIRIEWRIYVALQD